MRHTYHAGIILLTLLFTSTGWAAPRASSPDISGTWQGTVEGEHPARIAWLISKDKSGSWQLLNYYVDYGSEPTRANTVSLDGKAIKVSVGLRPSEYEGTLSSDQQSMEGTWTARGVTKPLVFHRATKRTAWKLDSSPHTVRFVTVDHDVNLEVLDWGGKGQPIVLLTGMGDNAHVYDQFAPKLVAVTAHHVLGITRRGFGASSAPADGYSSERLADDVLEALQQLKISRPILMGHSIAGQELTSIGTRHPEKVAALIYLEAGYDYAFYNGGDLNFDADEVRKQLDVLRQGDVHAAQQLLATDLPRLTRDLQAFPKDGLVQSPADSGPPPPRVPQAIFLGERKYAPFSGVPVLAIFADPHQDNPSAAYLEQAMPTAHVVRLVHADHYVFRSNEADVLREVNAFIAGLPPTP